MLPHQKKSYRAATGGLLSKKVFLKISQNSQKTPVSQSLFLLEWTPTPAQVFSYKFCEIFKNTFFKEQL